MTTTPATPPPAGIAGISAVHRLTSAYLIVALLALLGANVPGLLQALDHAGLDLYPAAQPVLRSYYQGLTVHGVLNVLVWTTFFICGFLTFVTVYALRTPLASLRLAWATFWLMVVGLVLAAWPILTNEASVLFTFYPPLKAHPAFYLGLTLVVVGTWFVTANLALTYRRWRRSHPTERTPIAAFGSLVTFAMWTLASVGVAVEMLALLIPWSLGLVAEIDPLLARTLFWLTGHPIVYFWLLPAYVSWYAMVPRLAGGQLFSAPMARAAFILFLLLSTPLGLHHQFTDPGIWEQWKLLHAFLTFVVFFPSLLTFFNVVASLESGARARGGTGWVAWTRRLPWGDPALTAQVLAMILFAFGGIGGLVNASYNVNLIVHNTAWIVGHFHLTVGTAVTLSFMGITYWLVPLLSGRQLFSRRLALAQAWTWFVGMAVFSETLHRLGLLGMPRRTAMSLAPYVLPEWRGPLLLVGIGGVVLFVSGVLYFLNLGLTLVASRQPAAVEVPLAEYGDAEDHSPAFLDRFRPWLVAAVALVLVAYGPTLIHLLGTLSPVVGRRVW
ncbi:MAG: b(o/a)3-type cytochrome-c oxidase subunit 1 [Chloroflexi bacterium]|nr:b(o/a)3-type cytochrome-c oxidase subunit 1 [Chloroflexota bacterium]